MIVSVRADIACHKRIPIVEGGSRLPAAAPNPGERDVAAEAQARVAANNLTNALVQERAD
ncbi:MAG: hypothetical protein ACLP8S_16235 [Solirubrobacteraceae bacterium]